MYIFYNVEKCCYDDAISSKVKTLCKDSTKTCYSLDNNVDKECVDIKVEIKQLKELIETRHQQNEAKCRKPNNNLHNQ